MQLLMPKLSCFGQQKPGARSAILHGQPAATGTQGGSILQTSDALHTPTRTPWSPLARLDPQKGKDTKPSSGFVFPCPKPSGLPSHHGILWTYRRSFLLGGLSCKTGHVVDDGGEVGGSVKADVGQAGRVCLDNAFHTFRESRETRHYRVSQLRTTASPIRNH